IHTARIQPGPSRYRRTGPCCGFGGAAWTSWCSVVSVTSPLRGQELDEGVELLVGDARERRHDVLRIPRLHVTIRIDDRLLDELVERLVRRLRVLRKLVEIRADLAGRAGGLEGVASRTLVLLEDGGACSVAVRGAHRARLLVQPGVEGGRLHDDRGRPH